LESDQGAYEDMTLKAIKTLENCDVIVGYTVYVDLVKEQFCTERISHHSYAQGSRAVPSGI